MRNFLFFSPLFLFFFNCYAQNNIKIGSYVLPGAIEGEKLLKVEMPFGKADIINIVGDTIDLKNAGDIFIDVVCTDYPSTADLQKLNRARVLSFLKRFSFVSDTQLVQMNFLRQLDGVEKEKAQTMFHGLVIRYRSRQTLETMKADLVELEKILIPVEKDTVATGESRVFLKDKIYDPVEPKDSSPHKFIGKDWYTQIGRGGMVNTELCKEKINPEDSFMVLSPKEALRQRWINRSEYREWKKIKSITLFFPRWVKTEKPVLAPDLIAEDSVSINNTYDLPDSTIFKIFTRTKWKNPTVIGDVTGSMYPYTAQLLLWLKLHSLDSLTTKYAFFNDGDNTPDNKKKLGSTGGIYFQNCTSFDEVKNLVKQTMLKGGGGDCPENNIEALLLAEKEFPENDFQVLIADNWAPIKDMSLFPKLTKPVRIVLCGVQNDNINIDYLNLARQTKGSVHLMEQDLYNLATLHEGETLTIGRKHFKIKDGLFIDADEQVGVLRL